MATVDQQQRQEPTGRRLSKFGRWLHDSVEAGRRALEEGTDRLRSAFQAEQDEATMSPEERFEKLPTEMQLAGALGFEEPEGFDMVRLPDSFKAFALRVPKDKAGAVKAVLDAKLAIPCSTTFGGDPKSGTVQLTYITSADNLTAVRQHLNSLGVKGVMVEAESQPLMARTARGEVMPLCNFRLPDLGRGDPNSIQVKTFTEGSDELRLQPVSATAAKSNKIDLYPPTEEATLAAVKAQQKISGEKISKVPPAEHCTSLLLDSRFFERKSPDDPRVAKLQKRLRFLDAPPITFVTQRDGKVVVGSTSSKGAASVLKFANELFAELGHEPAGCLFHGNIVHNADGTYHIEGFPDTSAGSQLSKLLASPGLRLETDFANLWAPDSTSRESTVCEIKTKPIQDVEGFVDLESCREKISLYRGGPRVCVGQGDVVDRMVRVLQHPERGTRTIIVTGQGGAGKSRTVMEALKKINEEALKSGKTGVYAVLTMSEDFASRQKYHTILRVISQMVSQSSEDAALSQHPDIKELVEFDAKPLEDKLEEAADPQKRKGIIRRMYCAYEACAEIKGTVAAVSDDFHCADEGSAQMLAELFGQLATSEAPIVIMPMLREGEEHCPEALKAFERKVLQDDGKILKIKIGSLSLSHGPIATEYVDNFPFEFNGKEVTLAELGKHSGDWNKAIGALANGNPLRMNDFLTLFLTQENIEIGEGVNVKLTPAGEKKLQEWQTLGTEGTAGVDFKSVGRDFFEQLKNPDSKRLLQCITLLRGVANLRQIRLIADKVLGIAGRQNIEAAIAELIQRKCLLEVPLASGEGTTADDKQYQIRGDALRAHAEASIAPDARAGLSSQLFNMGLGDVFTLGVDIASSEIGRPQDEDRFWTDFGTAVRRKLAGAEERRDVNNGYLYAESIMEIPVFKEIIEMAKREALPKIGNVQKLAVEAVLTRARNAFYTGRFDKTKDAMDDLEAIFLKNRALVTPKMMAEIYLLNFKAACALNNAEGMEMLYEIKLNKGALLSPEDKLICDLRLANKRGEKAGDFSETRGLYAANEDFLERLDQKHKKDHNDHPSPIATEAHRLTLRAREGEIKKGMHCRIELPGVGPILQAANGTIEDAQKKQLFKIMIDAMRQRGLEVDVNDALLAGDAPLPLAQVSGIFTEISKALLAKNGIRDDEFSINLKGESEVKGQFINTCRALEHREFDNTMAMQPGALSPEQAQASLELLEELDDLLEAQRQHPGSLDGFGEIAAREQRARTLARLGDHRKALNEFMEVRRLAEQLNLAVFSTVTAKAIGDLRLVGTATSFQKPLSASQLSVEITPNDQFDVGAINDAHKWYKIGLQSAQELADPYMQLAMRGEDLRAYSMSCLNFLRELEFARAIPTKFENLKERAKPHVTEALKLFGEINREHGQFGSNKDRIEARYCINGDSGPIIHLAIELEMLTEAEQRELTDAKQVPYLADLELEAGLWNASRMTDSGPGAPKGAGQVRRRYNGQQYLRELMHGLRNPQPQEQQPE